MGGLPSGHTTGGSGSANDAGTARRAHASRRRPATSEAAGASPSRSSGEPEVAVSSNQQRPEPHDHLEQPVLRRMLSQQLADGPGEKILEDPPVRGRIPPRAPAGQADLIELSRSPNV